MHHTFLTLVIPVDPQKRGQIETALDTLGNLANIDVRKAFARSLIVHFIAGALVHGDGIGADHLILEASTDADTDTVLRLFDNADPGVADQFGPLLALAGHGRGAASEFLARFVIKSGFGLLERPGLPFSGTPGMTVRRINDEWEFAAKLREICDQVGGSGSALATVNAMRDVISNDPEFAKMRRPAEVEILAPEKEISFATLAMTMVWQAVVTFLWPVILLAGMVAVYASMDGFAGGFWRGILELVPNFLFWSVILSLAAVAGVLIWLFNRERHEDGDNSLPDATRLAAVRRREDQGSIQNHLFGVSVLKPGILRYLTLRLGMFIVAMKVSLQFRPGHLGDIGTIHFARWFMIPGTNKLIFCSNYGGSWESYLEDFITKASEGLSAVWSNTLGFPTTRLLVFRGAADGDRFKRWARRQQIPTRFWYCAYPQASTARIRINAAIRRGFNMVETEDAAAAFLAQFSSRTRPEWDVETGEIQTLMFGALRKHPQSLCLFLELPNDPGAARAWLANASRHVAFGAAPNPERVDQIGISARGMLRLGLTEREIDGFNFPFGTGMAARARILLDSGSDHPDTWYWGTGENAVDVSWLIYLGPAADNAPYEERLAAARDAIRKPLETAGGRLIHQIETTNLSKRPETKTCDAVGNPFQKEPFGFVDGVSQPVIRGMRPGATPPRDQHLMEPGEFVLGYPDNRGTLPQTPVVAASRDPDNHLPVAGIRHDATDYPMFDPPGNQDRDLGRNGTYIAIRQLSQKVTDFETFKREAAAATKGHPGIPAGLDDRQRGEYLAAKMVGRWQDGTSMIRFPNAPGSGWDGEKPVPPDNDFWLGRDDPTGAACPFGSHVRRSNPRDSFLPGSEKQLEIANRHRILRRGRFFGADVGSNSGETGLLFICANADLERQFEFVQQTWIMARQFHGLDNEIDPVLGRSEESGQLTIPTAAGPIFLSNIPDFTEVVGGEYFFMPSRAALRFLAAPLPPSQAGQSAATAKTREPETDPA